MNKKLIGVAGLICLAFVVAACGGVARGDTSSIGVDDESINRPISDTARVVVKVEQTPDVAAVTAAENASDKEPAGESQAGVVEPVAATIDLPKSENDVSNTEFEWSQLLSRDSIRSISRNSRQPTPHPTMMTSWSSGWQLTGKPKPTPSGH